MSEQTFNPNEHLMQIKSGQTSKDYLPVQWRLVWFRSLCPQGTIETELVLLDLDRETEEEAFVWNNEKRRSEKVIKKANGFALFRATAKDGKGGVATGTGSEKAASFADYIEKAETKAIGRALAALGYGTQFVGDEFNEAHRIVDSPVEEPSGSGSNAPAGGSPAAASRNPHGAMPGEIRGASDQRVRLVTAPPAQANQPAISPAPAASPAATSEDEAAITPQQVSSIRKLHERLGKPVPADLEQQSFAQGKELIGQLTQEYRNRKAS